MKNIKELRTAITEIFEELKEGERTNKDATSFSNLAGRIISTTKVEIDYSKLHKKKKVIKFLEYEDEEVVEDRKPRKRVRKKFELVKKGSEKEPTSVD